MKQNLFNCGYEMLAGMLMLFVNFYVYETAVPAITVVGSLLVLWNISRMLFDRQNNENDASLKMYVNLALLLLLISWAIVQYLGQGSLNSFVQLTLPLMTMYEMLQIYFWFHYQKYA